MVLVASLDVTWKFDEFGGEMWRDVESMPRVYAVYTLTVEDQLCSWWTCAAGASNLLSFTIIHHHSHGHNLGSVWKCHVLKTNME